jgi:hypothetical protein
MDARVVAPEIAADRWFNVSGPLTLAGLRGRVVLLHAFQMLCPGCVSHGTPQAERAHRLFAGNEVQVIGIHTVFENHAAMIPLALEVFIREYRLTMPIAVDRPSGDSPIPQTMQAYGMHGTPSHVLIGRDGSIRHHGFGAEEDMVLGACIAALIAEPAAG